MKTVNQQVGLDQVLQVFVQSMQLPDGGRLYDYKFLYDPMRQQFAFTFNIEEAGEGVQPLNEREPEVEKLKKAAKKKGVKK